MIVFHKRKKKKLKEFISEGQTPEVNNNGINKEYRRDLIISVFLFVCAILGLMLGIMDIRDADNFMEFAAGVMTFKYKGSLIGGAIMIIAIIGLIFKNPKVHIKK